MKTALIIGNGPSRKFVDFKALNKNYHYSYICNKGYHDFGDFDFHVACDKDAIQDILDNCIDSLYEGKLIIRRKSDKINTMNSGRVAIGHAIHSMNCIKIQIIGFDSLLVDKNPPKNSSDNAPIRGGNLYHNHPLSNAGSDSFAHYFWNLVRNHRNIRFELMHTSNYSYEIPSDCKQNTHTRLVPTFEIGNDCNYTCLEKSYIVQSVLNT